ncbi:MAG: TRAP transporter small permease [Alphaproteobacteria bacterium]|nr:TRAP transporter small permease [Alphaproteobacteria bacterium]
MLGAWRTPVTSAPPPNLLDRTAAMLSRLGAYAAAAVCLAMAALILLDVLLRNVFAASADAIEFAGYGIAAMIFLGMGHAFERGSMIRVTLLSGLAAPDGAPRRALEIAVGTATLGVVGLAIWCFWLSVRRNYLRGYRSESMVEVPLWIPEAVLLVGLVIFWLQLLAYLLRVLRGGEMVGGGSE